MDFERIPEDSKKPFGRVIRMLLNAINALKPSLFPEERFDTYLVFDI